MLSPTNAHTLGTAGHLKGRFFSKFGNKKVNFINLWGDLQRQSPKNRDFEKNLKNFKQFVIISPALQKS